MQLFKTDMLFLHPPQRRTPLRIGAGRRYGCKRMSPISAMPNCPHIARVPRAEPTRAQDAVDAVATLDRVA